MWDFYTPTKEKRNKTKKNNQTKKPKTTTTTNPKQTKRTPETPAENQVVLTCVLLTDFPLTTQKVMKRDVCWTRGFPQVNKCDFKIPFSSPLEGEACRRGKHHTAVELSAV